MKVNFTIAILLLLCFRMYAQNSAYIHRDSILATLPHYSAKVAKIDSTGKIYQQEIKTAKEEWGAKLGKLLQSYNVKENESVEQIKKRMTAVDTAQLGLLVDEEKLIAKRAKNYELMLGTLYKSEVQPLLDKVNAAIESYAKSNKIDVVYTIEALSPAVAYIDRRKNITKKIISKIKN